MGIQTQRLRAKRVFIILLIAILILCIRLFVIDQAEKISVTEYNMQTTKVSKTYRIVHLSDLFGQEAGESYRYFFDFSSGIPYRYSEEKILDTIIGFEPNVIVITGDIFRENQVDHQIIYRFIEKLQQIAPVYAVAGDTDYKLSFPQAALDGLSYMGVSVLKGETFLFDELSFIGMDEQTHSSEEAHQQLTDFEQKDGYKILLSHHSEKFDEYSEYDIDLMLSGNTLGGRYRLPFVRHEKYYYGKYEKNNTYLIVSSGLGNPSPYQLIPDRLRSPKEVGLITIQSKGI